MKASQDRLLLQIAHGPGRLLQPPTHLAGACCGVDAEVVCAVWDTGQVGRARSIGSAVVCGIIADVVGVARGVGAQGTGSAVGLEALKRWSRR